MDAKQSLTAHRPSQSSAANQGREQSTDIPRTGSFRGAAVTWKTIPEEWIDTKKAWAREGEFTKIQVALLDVEYGIAPKSAESFRSLQDRIARLPNDLGPYKGGLQNYLAALRAPSSASTSAPSHANSGALRDGKSSPPGPTLRALSRSATGSQPLHHQSPSRGPGPVPAAIADGKVFASAVRPTARMQAPNISVTQQVTELFKILSDLGTGASNYLNGYGSRGWATADLERLRTGLQTLGRELPQGQLKEAFDCAHGVGTLLEAGAFELAVVQRGLQLIRDHVLLATDKGAPGLHAQAKGQPAAVRPANDSPAGEPLQRPPAAGPRAPSAAVRREALKAQEPESFVNGTVHPIYDQVLGVLDDIDRGIPRMNSWRSSNRDKVSADFEKLSSLLSKLKDKVDPGGKRSVAAITKEAATASQALFGGQKANVQAAKAALERARSLLENL